MEVVAIRADDPRWPARRDDESRSPITISLQPSPSLTRVVHFKLYRWWVTAIMRHWKPGETVRCKLCPKCVAYQDGCLTMVSGKVELDQARLLSINKRAIQG